MVVAINDLPAIKYAEYRSELTQAFIDVRDYSINLTTSLSAEDMQLQSMPDASPTKWHLAHTTWFFEAFILAKHQSDFAWHDPLFAQLFNSYYNAMGDPFPRPKRGMISRPTVDEVIEYRLDVNSRMLTLLRQCNDDEFQKVAHLLVLGINHEQQHQELILTDIKHALYQNPSFPAVFENQSPSEAEANFQWLPISGGEIEVGYNGEGFCFDNELPCHRVLVQDYEIANRLVTNAEWLEFINDGGYQQPLLWLSDGWAWRCTNDITAPLYWQKFKETWNHFTLSGLKPVLAIEPVTHISFYEADAYARWSGHRLPTEHEWEHASQSTASSYIYGKRWEWTASPYTAFPGFHPSEGNVGEYNGKFMINQMVLRGVSGATAEHHSRTSYRNFFYPEARWQFSGLRLIKNVY